MTHCQIIHIKEKKMKKKILFICLMVSLLFVVFALSVNAQSTNEFAPTPETIPGIDLSEMSTDTTARVVIVDANGAYHTYPAQYVVSSNTKFYYNFKPINDALKTSYTKNSVVRIEVPDEITIATKTGDLCSCTNLVEIKFSPNSQLHTLEYGCFYNNRKLEKLNIPKNVKTIGELIINYSTLKELVFDDGFNAVLPRDSFVGATGVKKVVFSNQMTTVGIQALNDTLGEELEEFYMGASLMDLGAENMSYVKQSVKLYVPAQFLSEVDEITMNTYSWWASSACLPTGVIFFTGTKDQAQALMDKSTYDRVFAPNAALVKWDSGKSDDSYVPASGWTIVYDYNKCKAFYDNEHLEDTNPCLIECTRCGMADLDPNGQHSFTDKITYEDYYSNGTLSKTCATENCPYHTSPLVDNTLSPLFTFLGFSSNGVDIAVGYTVNIDAYNAFVEHGNALASFGVVGYIPSVENPNPLNAGASGVELVEPEYTIQASIPAIYSGFDFIIRGFNVTDSISLVMCAYIYDGSKIIYLGSGTQSTNATTITISNGQLVA